MLPMIQWLRIYQDAMEYMDMSNIVQQTHLSMALIHYMYIIYMMFQLNKQLVILVHIYHNHYDPIYYYEVLLLYLRVVHLM